MGRKGLCPDLFHLTYRYILFLRFCPCNWGTQGASGYCSQSERLHFGRGTRNLRWCFRRFLGRNRKSRSHEVAGRREYPEAVPSGKGGTGENGLNQIISVRGGTRATKGGEALLQCAATDQLPGGRPGDRVAWGCRKRNRRVASEGFRVVDHPAVCPDQRYKRVYRLLFGGSVCRLLNTRERTYSCEGGSMKT